MAAADQPGKAEMDEVWHAPFCANEDVTLTCPNCKEKGTVCVREKDSYWDGSEVEAFCGECHANLIVWACVDVSFTEPEVVE